MYILVSHFFSSMILCSIIRLSKTGNVECRLHGHAVLPVLNLCLVERQDVTHPGACQPPLPPPSPPLPCPSPLSLSFQPRRCGGSAECKIPLIVLPHCLLFGELELNFEGSGFVLEFADICCFLLNPCRLGFNSTQVRPFGMARLFWLAEGPETSAPPHRTYGVYCKGLGIDA